MLLVIMVFNYLQGRNWFQKVGGGGGDNGVGGEQNEPVFEI